MRSPILRRGALSTWHSRALVAYAAAAALSLATPAANAIRPFITDDARVVGKGRVQLESWVRADRGRLELWALPAIGPTRWLELTAGGVQGSARESDRSYNVAGPLVQAKILLRTTMPLEFPGFALSIGSLLPYGVGSSFVPPPNAFAYVASTFMFRDESALIHANVGLAVARREGIDRRGVTFGVGTQIHVARSVNLVSEMFSGDPYAEVSGAAIQNGFRFILSEYVQLDATMGSGLSGSHRLPFWISAGLRVASSPKW